MLPYKNAVVVRKPTYFARHFINISAPFMQGNYKLTHQLHNLVCIPSIEARTSNLRVPCVWGWGVGGGGKALTIFWHGKQPVSTFTECTETTCDLDSPNGELQHVKRSLGQKPANRWSPEGTGTSYQKIGAYSGQEGRTSVCQANICIIWQSVQRCGRRTALCRQDGRPVSRLPQSPPDTLGLNPSVGLLCAQIWAAHLVAPLAARQISVREEFWTDSSSILRTWSEGELVILFCWSHNRYHVCR
jgi:hypothetical protein